MEKTDAFHVIEVFYTDDDIHYEWDKLTLLDKNIPHFELISYQKSKTIQDFTSGKKYNVLDNEGVHGMLH